MEPSATDKPVGTDLSRRNLVLTLAGLCCINLIAALDSTALSVSIPTIATHLHANTVQAYWTGTSFLLASAVFQPCFATLCGVLGRRAMAIAALIIFAIGTIVCGAAPNIAALLAGRTIQGIGGGGLLSVTYVVLADLLSPRERPKGILLIGIVWLVGTSCGPVMGGGFTYHATWRWIFWICLPFVAISLFLLAFLRTPHQRPHLSEALKMVDWAGICLFVVSLTIFLMAISWGGSMFPWASYETLVPLLLGALGMIAWAVYESLVPNTPMVPLAILKTRTAAIAFIGTFLMGFVQFALLYYLPLYYEVVKGYSPLLSGLALIPNCLAASIATICSGVLMPRFGRYKIVALIGWALLALGCGLLLLLSSHTSIAAWIFINVVSGLGLGFLYQGLNSASIAEQLTEHQPLANSLTPFFRALGQAFGIAVGNAIFQNAFKTYLLHGSDIALRQQAVTLARSSASLGLLVAGMGHSSERSELLAAFNSSLHTLWYVLMAISLFAGVLSLLMHNGKINKNTSATKDAPMDLERMSGSDKRGSDGDNFTVHARDGTSTIASVRGPAAGSASIV